MISTDGTHFNPETPPEMLFRTIECRLSKIQYCQQVILIILYDKYIIKANTIRQNNLENTAFHDQPPTSHLSSHVATCGATCHLRCAVISLVKKLADCRLAKLKALYSRHIVERCVDFGLILVLCLSLCLDVYVYILYYFIIIIETT